MTEPWQVAVSLLGLFTLVQAVAIFALARSLGVVQIAIGLGPTPRTLEPLSVGADAPRITGTDARTRHAIELERGDARRWLLIFVSPTCSSCSDAVVSARRLSEDALSTATPVIVVRGSLDQSALVAESAGHLLVLADADGTMHETYHIREVPFAYFVTGGVVAASGRVSTPAQMHQLAAGRDGDNEFTRPAELAGPAAKGGLR